MSSKPVGGFDLKLGALYNDFWFNRAEPLHNYSTCTKYTCGGLTTLHRLEKLVFAFGKMTIKTCDLFTCPVCLHEEVVSHTASPKRAASKKNLVRLFAKLPKSIQQQILGGYNAAK